MSETPELETSVIRENPTNDQTRRADGKPDKRGILHSVMTAWAEYEFGAPVRVLPREQTMSGGGDCDEGPLPLVEWEIVNGALPRLSGVVRDILRQVYYHGCPLEGVHLPPGKAVGWLGWPWPDLRDILLADALRRVSKALTQENIARIRKQYSQKVEAP